ncbi:MAG: tRNA threonylcarbamoyladenosine dehydratase [Betaproteobacteria bacterium]
MVKKPGLAEYDQQPDSARRFSGLDRLYGAVPGQAIRSAHVVVVGVGGVGSWSAEALARSGVGRITLIDMDHVSESNINRQVHALTPTLGMSKISAMAQRITLINPYCQVVGVDDFVDANNWPSLVPTDVDAVIDACDQVIAKTAMAQWALSTKTLFITVGAAGGKRMAHATTIVDLCSCTHDPLLAQVRYRLRKFHQTPKEGKKIGIACVSSPERVVPTQQQGDNTLNCHGYGSLVTVTATFGLCAAGWVIDKLSLRPTVCQKINAII